MLNRLLIYFIVFLSETDKLNVAGQTTPATLPSTDPVDLTTLTSPYIENPVEYEWYMTEQFYMLTKIKMWKTTTDTDGFQVWYNVMPSDAFDGWPELTYTFGSTGETSGLQTETFDFDLVSFSICFDDLPGKYETTDFEGLEFTESDGTVTYISPTCPSEYETTEDLSS